MQGKNKRSSLITTFVTETSGKEISNLLYNNMIPVNEQIITVLELIQKQTHMSLTKYDI